MFLLYIEFTLNLCFLLLQPPTKRKKDKQRPPLVIPVPDSYVTRAIEALRNNPPASKGFEPERVRAVAHATQQILNDLQVGQFCIDINYRFCTKCIAPHFFKKDICHGPIP